MSGEINLSRRLILEEPVRSDDGMGGVSVGWNAIAEIWADIRARTGREGYEGNRRLPLTALRIIVRGAPMGDVLRPKSGQRFIEGSRVFSIIAVSERDAGGRFLDCWAEEVNA